MKFSAQITGLKEIEASHKKLAKDIHKSVGKSIRKALNAGAKEWKNAIKPGVPVLKSSTNFRQKGTIKNNIRHRTRVAKDGLSGYTVIRVMRPKGQRMAKIGENTRDRRDPFYWWMVEYGTQKMEGRGFMESGAKRGKDRAFRKTEEVFHEEIKRTLGSASKK